MEFKTKNTPGPWISNGHSIYGPRHEESRHANGRILIADVVRGSHRRDPLLDGGHDNFEFDSESDVALIIQAPSMRDYMIERANDIKKELSLGVCYDPDGAKEELSRILEILKEAGVEVVE